jgi:hypothetical protein
MSRLADEGTVTSLEANDGLLVVQEGNVEQITKTDFEKSLTLATSRTHNTVLTFDETGFAESTVLQSGPITYTLAASGHRNGVVIEDRILSNGTSTISFPSEFNVYGLSNDGSNSGILPMGTYSIWMVYLGGRVEVSIPAGVTSNAEPQPTNNAPTVANALANQSKTQGYSSFTVPLSGVFTDADGDPLTYSATSSNTGIATVSVSGATLTVNEVAGTGSVTITVTANDGKGGTVSNNFALSVNAVGNVAPTANAGADQSIEEGNTLTLTGSGTDSDGTIASYAWSKISGGAATITSPSSATTTVTGLTAGNYTFRLTVTDNAGATAADDIAVTVTASVGALAFTYSPTHNATAVSPSSPITITANRAIRHTDATAITDANVASLLTLTYPNMLESVPFSASINAAKTLITITPTGSMNYSRKVRLTLAPVEDSDGAETTLKTIEFTTAANANDPGMLNNVGTLLYPENIAGADGASLLNWADVSGDNKPAIGVSGTAPVIATLNGKKVARFTGAQFLKIPNVIVGGTNLASSFFIVVKADHTAGQTIRTMFATHSGTSNSSQNCSYITTRENKDIIYQGQAHLNTQQQYLGRYSAQLEMYVVNKKGGTMVDVWRNSVKISENIDVTTLALGDELMLGALITQTSTTGQYFFTGDIMAFGAYYRELTNAEIDGLFTGVGANKCGVIMENAYAPMYLTTDGLINAYEVPAVRFAEEDLNSKLENFYPVNRGLTKVREDHRLQVSAPKLAPRLNISAGIKVLQLNGVDEGLKSNLTYGLTEAADLPFTIGYVGKIASSSLDQIMFGLQGSSGSSNNLGSLGKSSTNQHYLQRRVSTIKDNKSMGAQDTNFHIVFGVMKTGGLFDLYVDGVKTVADFNATTSTAATSAQRILLGYHNGGGNQHANGEFVAGYVYSRALTSAEIIAFTNNINTRLGLY